MLFPAPLFARRTGALCDRAEPLAGERRRPCPVVPVLLATLRKAAGHRQRSPSLPQRARVPDPRTFPCITACSRDGGKETIIAFLDTGPAPPCS
jgi:hypothetical protein